MTKFIPGKDLIERFAWRGFQYFDHLRKGNLQPHDPVTGNRIIDPGTEHGKKIIAAFKNASTKTLEEYLKIVRIKNIRSCENHGGYIVNKKTEQKLKEKARILYNLNLMRQNGCIKESFALSHDEKQAEEQISEAKKWLFKTAEVLAFEKKHDTNGAPNATPKVFPCPPGTTWEKVKITLIADDKVRIETPHAKRYFFYHELRMGYRGASDKHTLLWSLLKIFASSYEGVSFENIKDGKEKRRWFSAAKRFDKHLRKLFGINESIYKAPYNKDKKYKTKIFFSDQTQVVQKATETETEPTDIQSFLKKEIKNIESKSSKRGKDKVHRQRPRH